MNDPRQAPVLLQAAERYLEAARRMLDPGIHDVVFGQVAQQAAENYSRRGFACWASSIHTSMTWRN